MEGGQDRLERLARAIQDVRSGARDHPRTAKLLSAGVHKTARKVAEEAAELAIEAVTGNKKHLVLESVDLLYNLLALWAVAGIKPEAVWKEMDRREARLGMVAKLPKPRDSGDSVAPA